MKSFSVNKNSWHYKLNIQMVKTNDRINYGNHEETYVMSKDNLCSYWQMTIWSMFKVLLVVTFVIVVIVGLLTALYTMGYAFIAHTQTALISTAIVIGFFATIVAIVSVFHYVDKRKREKLNRILYEGETETSLAKAKYSSWKSGICLPVEFKE